MVLDLVQAIFDPLRNLDFALAGQEFDGTHLPHVHADRVGRTAELGIDTRERRLGLDRGVLVVIRHVFVGENQRLGIGRLLVDGDAHVVNHIDDILDLFGIDDVIGQVIIDLRVGQEALLLAAGNQFLQLLGLLAAANHCAFFRQDDLSSV